MASNFYCRTVLVGGGESALDEIDGAELNDLDFAIVSIFDKIYMYTLDVDNAASESSPDIISPDTNAGDKRWILQEIMTSNSSGTGHITILPYAYNQIVQGAWTWWTQLNQFTSVYFYNSTNSNNDQINFKAYFSKGVYTFVIISQTAPYCGILSLLLDLEGVLFKDLYTSSTINNAVFSFSSIVIPASKIYDIDLKVTSQNPSSSGFYIPFSSFSFYRTK